MKKTEHSYELSASADEVFDFLLSERFTERLEESLDKISDIEAPQIEELDDGRIKRTCRFTAPTQLPRFLKRFEDKAPDQVYWDDIWLVDRADHRIDWNVVPEMPDHWHERYECEGLIAVDDLGEGRSSVDQSMAFEIDAPMGFGMVINRALKSQLDEIFGVYADVLRGEFGG